MIVCCISPVYLICTDISVRLSLGTHSTHLRRRAVRVTGHARRLARRHTRSGIRAPRSEVGTRESRAVWPRVHSTIQTNFAHHAPQDVGIIHARAVGGALTRCAACQQAVAGCAIERGNRRNRSPLDGAGKDEREPRVKYSVLPSGEDGVGSREKRAETH